MKIIMYHYVNKILENKSKNGLEFDVFQRQLDFMSKNGGFVSPQQLLDSCGDFKEEYLLTFDDGLSEHATHVLDELNKRDIKAIFSINSHQYISGKLINVHKIHKLLGESRLKLLPLIDELKKECNFKYYSMGEINFPDLYKNQSNEEEIFIKKMLNYYLPYDISSDLIDRYCNIYNIIIKNQEWYPDLIGLKKIADNHFLSSHTHKHGVMSRLNYKEQYNEIMQNLEFLESNLGVKINFYTHPYGNKSSYNLDTVDILRKLGFKFAFSYLERQCNLGDIANSPYELPRIDCKSLQY